MSIYRRRRTGVGRAQLGRAVFGVVMLLGLATSGSGASAAEGGPGAGAVRVIFDTDMSSDCDDCGALAVLNQLANRGEAEILACVTDKHEKHQAVAAAISAINTYYGRPEIPIGTYQGKNPGVVESRYTAQLRDEFPQHALPDDEESSALSVYRRTLAAAPDGSVTVVSVGLLVNLRDLLESGADGSSNLDGASLVKQKVKRLVVMGGKYPRSDAGNPEHNFSAMGTGADTHFVVEHWPTPVTFVGWEIGRMIVTGGPLAGMPKTNPVRRAYELYHVLPQGRESWDLTAVLAAVRDPELYWRLVPGTCRVSDDGSDEWMDSSKGKQSYVAEKRPPEEITAVLNDLLVAPPKSDGEGREPD